ncbi:MAG: trypsin-like peptidase domain-containing protein [Planctomycetota bacterium]
MTQLTDKLGRTAMLAAAGLFAAFGPACETFAANADDPRLTPLVRAVQRVRASVVDIHSEKTAYDEGSVFSPRAGRKVNGMGTGIVVDPRGYVVTNHHVVQDVESLRTTLYDGSTHTARVISSDPAKDLAIIKIDPDFDLDVMPLGTSSDLLLGETVIAVGNAFGYEGTVTAGIVSSLSRDVEVNETQSYEDLIQTDAAINPGNSGGPLLNLRGEVIGINVAIRAGAQRIGFAIPIDDAREVISRLLSVERIDGLEHGLEVEDRKSPEIKEAIVKAVRPGSPAADAAFEVGDVIVEAGDVSVVDGVDFERALIGHKTEAVRSVTVRRGEELVELELKLARAKRPTSVASNTTRPRLPSQAEPADGGSIPGAWIRLGVRLTPAASSSVAGTRYRGGMRVTAVRPGSPAARRNIRKGDVLVGLHIWETINAENVSYVLGHPRLSSFNPLTFYIVRGRETYHGQLSLAAQVASR